MPRSQVTTTELNSVNIQDGSIVNADINASADIAVSKLAAGTAHQVLINSATPTPTWTTLSGDVTNALGVVTIGAAKVTGTKSSQPLRVHSVMQRIGGLAGSDDRFAFIAPIGSRNIMGAKILSDTATTGSGAGTVWEFKLINLTQASAIVAQKSTITAELAANTPHSLTVDNAEDDMTASDVYELQITKTGTPTDLGSAEIMFQVDYEGTD